jgi:hypothetical protein
MAYKLVMLAPGSYDVVLDDVVVASLVRSIRTHRGWTAELLCEVPPEQRPVPFIDLEHEFSDFEDVCRWLRDPDILTA